MKKIFLLIFLSFLIFGSLFSQNEAKKDLTLEDAVLKRFSDYYPEYISGLQWKGNSNVLVKKSDDMLALLQMSVESKNTNWDTLIKASEINSSLGIELKYFPRIDWQKDSCIVFRNGYDYFKYNIYKKKGKKFTRVPLEGSNNDLCKKTGNIAYTIGNNLHIKKANGDCISVTNFDDKNIVAGQSIARNEFGIEKGTFWSPKGAFLAFYQKDESDVGDYPLVDITTREATLKSIKYPMAGMNSEYPSVGIYSIETGKTIYLNTDNGEKDHYLTNLTWGPDEKYLYLAEINRAQNHMWFNKYDVKTGQKVKTLFEEENSKYVEPVDAAVFIEGKSDEFLWFSRRDGFKNLYRYNTEGELLNKVTGGKFPIHNILGFDKSGKYIYVTGADESGLNEYLYKATINNDKISKVSRQFGVHNYKMSKNGEYFIDIYSDLKTPRITQVINKKGKIVKQLLISENPLTDVKIGQTELLDIKAADGKTILHARMIKPYDFDATKKYKVLVYLYGGPHAQMIRNAWMAYAPLWMHYMANRGYIIFTVDNRGSDNRGFDFESVIHRNLGYNEMMDQMEGVKYLSTLPYVDTSKMAIHGWSFGGFMTTTMMLRQPGVFKVGVAGGPVTNWKWYEVMYGERYMDMPQENPDGYEKNNLLNYVDKLEGNLMLVIGSVDPVVVPQHSMGLIKKFIEAKKQVDFFSYPMHEHNVRGVDRAHLMRKILDYIDDKLNK
ncbi:MAG TPA: S9 family peptidase [Bacteroidetes bacterium]|nr:S9 family peptidase [Bacteroidota bacterium]